jgi:hypothetical protein
MVQVLKGGRGSGGDGAGAVMQAVRAGGGDPRRLKEAQWLVRAGVLGGSRGSTLCLNPPPTACG